MSMSKHTAISAKTKRIVWERDNHACIICGTPYANPEAHALYSRSHGGLGIEQNLITLCRPCHLKYDSGDGETRKRMKIFVREYLESIYGTLDDNDLVYKKWRVDHDKQ